MPVYLKPILYVLTAALTATLVTTTTALAGSGVGGVFNLGQTNAVDATTTLTGDPAANPLLRLIGLGTAATIRADADSGIAVNGISASGTGQFGQSTSGVGLYGTHTASTGSSSGVYGQTNSTDPGSAGVTGRNLAAGPGLQAIVSGNTVPPLKVNSSARVANLNADLLDGLDSATLPYWKLGGNTGTTPGSNFLGTTDFKAFVLRVNGEQALRLAPTFSAFYPSDTPNVIAGAPGNVVSPGLFGARPVIGGTIAGGGQVESNGSHTVSDPNRVTDDFGTVGGGVGNRAGDDNATFDSALWATVAGGVGNTASAQGSAVAGGFENLASGAESSVLGGQGNVASGGLSTVAGGGLNIASGIASFAAGSDAEAIHFGSFVWKDASGGGHPLTSNGNNTVSFGASGGARFVTAFAGDGTPTAGVKVAAGGGSWSSLSDRASKRDLASVDRRRLLARLDRIPITSWSYRSQDPSIRHLGPMAQDFRSTFGLGEDSRHIDTIDADGVALAAIQGLYRQNKALQRENRSLNARLTKLEQAFSKLSR